MKVTRKTTFKEYVIFLFASAYFAVMLSYAVAKLFEIESQQGNQILLLATFIPILTFWIILQIRFVNMQNWELTDEALIQGRKNPREHRLDEIDFVHVGIPFNPGWLLKLVKNTHPSIYRYHYMLRTHSLYIRFNDNSYMVFNLPEKESAFMEAYCRAVERKRIEGHTFSEKEMKCLSRLKVLINKRQYL